VFAGFTGHSRSAQLGRVRWPTAKNERHEPLRAKLVSVPVLDGSSSLRVSMFGFLAPSLGQRLQGYGVTRYFSA
jgi:hypothetical protein